MPPWPPSSWHFNKEWSPTLVWVRQFERQEAHPGQVCHGYPISDFMTKGVEVILVQGYLCKEEKTDGSLSEFSFYVRL